MENKQPLFFFTYIMPGQKENILLYANKDFYRLGFIVSGRSEVLILEFRLSDNHYSDLRLYVEESSNINYKTFNKKGSIPYKKNRCVKYYTVLIDFVHSYLNEKVQKYDYFTLDKCCYYLFYVYCYNTLDLHYIDFDIKSPFNIPNVEFYNRVFYSNAMFT